MIVKLTKHHLIKQTPTWGEFHEILPGVEYSPDIVVAFDIRRPTHGHFHNNFHEIFFVLDGELVLKLYNQLLNVTVEQRI